MRILAWSVSVSGLLLLGLVRPFNALEPAAAGTDTAFKVAYYNIQSGMGMTQLSGTCSFERNSNCTDRSKPLNAWGKGVVQAELDRAVKNDPAVIALGVSEAWTCAHPDAILKTLGWATHTGERNGVSLLARFGFAGTPEWFQLDTSLNVNPSDTQWVVRAPVCADASCSRSVQVFSAHWYASGETRTESFERQARDTVQFMDRLPQTEARVLVGDLNVWEEGGLSATRRLCRLPFRSFATPGTWTRGPRCTGPLRATQACETGTAADSRMAICGSGSTAPGPRRCRRPSA